MDGRAGWEMIAQALGRLANKAITLALVVFAKFYRRYVPDWDN
jgi:hypothetical protein